MRRGDVGIVVGHRSRDKVVEIRGDDGAEARLAARSATGPRGRQSAPDDQPG